MVLFYALEYNRIVQIKQGFFLYWSTSVGWGEQCNSTISQCGLIQFKSHRLFILMMRSQKNDQIINTYHYLHTIKMQKSQKLIV